MAHIAERMASHYLGLWLACQVFYCPDALQVVDYVTHARPQAFLGVPRVWEKFQNRLLGRFAEDRRSSLIMYAVRNGEKVIRARQQGRSPLVASLLAAVFDRVVFSKVRAGLGMDELVVAVTTAAPSDPDMIVFFNALGIPLCELYGLSESSGPAVSNLPGANRIGTVGKPLPGVDITASPTTRPRRLTIAAGFTPVISARSIPTDSSRSSVEKRTSSSRPPVRTSHRARSRWH
jgi:long-chain acyl-CoA synthetase